MPNLESAQNGVALLRKLFELASGSDGHEVLGILTKGLNQVLGADSTFVAFAVDSPPTRVKTIVDWSGGEFIDSIEYDLAETPCRLAYKGEPTIIPCDLAEKFEIDEDDGFNSFIGIPLFEHDGSVIGHLAVYARRVLDPTAVDMDLAAIFAYRAEAEVRRLLSESRLQLQLDQARNMASKKDEALLTVAHDLRSPLGTVIMALDLAQSNPVPDQVDSMLTMARTGATQLLKFVTDYLDLERLSATVPSDSMLEVGIGTFLEEQLSNLRSKFSSHGLNFTDNRAFDAPIKANPMELARVLENFVSNAVKFSPKDQPIRIEIDSNESIVCVTVVDHGPGISEDHLGDVFEPYFTSGTVNTDITGSGLGLAIAREIVNRHGGTIGVENRPGAGAAFYFELPITAK